MLTFTYVQFEDSWEISTGLQYAIYKISAEQKLSLQQNKQQYLSVIES